LLLITSAACSPTDVDSGGGEVIVHGTSFGMCGGYCTSVLEIDGTIARLIETSRDNRNFPRRILVLQLTAEKAARLRQLADTHALSRVAGTHGCPDCADGGAEWIAIQVQNTTIRTTYDYGLNLDPIAELQAELRSLRQRISQAW
jgi:hypothetical protein